jgi:hypothetical protein
MSDQIWVIEEALVAEDDTPLLKNGKLLRKYSTYAMIESNQFQVHVPKLRTFCS